MPRRARMRTSTFAGLAALVAVLCFAVGFAVSYDGDRGAVEVGAPDPTSTTTAAPTTAPPSTAAPDTTTSTAAPTTAVPTTASAPTTTAPVGPTPTSVPPTTTAPTTFATLPPTVATLPPTTAAPGRLDVTYPRDSQGRMLLLAGGAAAVIVQNVGGSPATFTVTGTGAVTVGATGTATGLLAPGEVRSIPVVADRQAPSSPPPHGTITVLGAQGLVATISVVIT